MKLKTFPLLGTWLFAALFLVSSVWFAIFRDGWGFLLTGLTFFGMLIWICMSFVMLLVERSRISLLRFSIAISALVAFFLAMMLGALVREQIFLANLNYYQSAVDGVVSRDKVTAPGIWREYLPNFSSMLVKDRILVQKISADELTVTFLTRDSSALGHSGLIYRSKDEAEGLHHDRPNIGFKRLAPKWYEFGE